MAGVVKAQRVHFNAHGHARVGVAGEPHPVDTVQSSCVADSCSLGSALQERALPGRSEEERRALEARLEATKDALARFEEQAKTREETAYKRGHEAGTACGKASALEDAGARDALLREGIDKAIAAFRQELQALESLAIDVAICALEKVFGDPAQQAQMIERTISHHIAGLIDREVIAVDVSGEDFPTVDELALLGEKIAAHGAIEIRRVAGLAAGQCVFRLGAESVDASLSTQLLRMRAALTGGAS